MTAPQRMIVRRDVWKNKDERERYGGQLVQLESERITRAWLVLTGPDAGRTFWYRDDQLEACPPSADPGIDTSEDW
jgi:hypothetical protein